MQDRQEREGTITQEKKKRKKKKEMLLASPHALTTPHSFTHNTHIKLT